MERSTIHAWVQRCPHCGYCASTIADDSDIAHSRINSREYLSQLEFPDNPELANSFLCKAMIEKEGGALSQSASWRDIPFKPDRGAIVEIKSNSISAGYYA